MNNKVLPIIVAVVVGILLVAGGFFAWKTLLKPPQQTEQEREVAKELSLDQRPYVTLTPGPSCEYTLALDRIQLKPDKIEYEIVYQDEKGVTQGASGTLTVSGKTKASKEVLFGTESSGHRKCDKGVEEGSVTLRLRNPDGKLIAKLTSQFHIQEGTKNLTLAEDITVSLDKAAAAKFLIMGTIGLPDKAVGEAVRGPFGVFTDGKTNLSAAVKLSGSGKLYGWNGTRWVELGDGKTSFLGTYILVK